MGRKQTRIAGKRMVGRQMGNQERLWGILKRLSAETRRRFDAGEFNARFRIQKSVYLLQAMKYPDASGYRYNMYLRGPYSPDLAKDYYAIDSWPRPRQDAINPAEIPTTVLQTIKDAFDQPEYFVETVVTLLFIMKTKGTNKSNTFDIARRLKPHMEPCFEGAWAFLSNKGLL